MDCQKRLLFQRESPTLIIDYLNVDPQLIKNGAHQHEDITGRSQENLGSQKISKSVFNQQQCQRSIILGTLNLMILHLKTRCTES